MQTRVSIWKGRYRASRWCASIDTHIWVPARKCLRPNRGTLFSSSPVCKTSSCFVYWEIEHCAELNLRSTSSENHSLESAYSQSTFSSTICWCYAVTKALPSTTVLGLQMERSFRCVDQECIKRWYTMGTRKFRPSNVRQFPSLKASLDNCLWIRIRNEGFLIFLKLPI